MIGEHLFAAMDVGAAQVQGDRWDAGKVGKRDAQSLPANEQYKYACLPPLFIASTLESWCNRCGSARHLLSTKCAHDANVDRAQRSGAAGNPGSSARVMRARRTPPWSWGRYS